jgi:hypothetical protein
MAGRAWNWWSGGLRRYRRAARAMQGSTLICRVIRCERDAMEFGDHEGYLGSLLFEILDRRRRERVWAWE